MAELVLDTVLFDLDGTLIDSIELIRQSYWHTFRVHFARDPETADWLSGLGRPLAWQFGQWTADPEEVQAMIRTYRAHNLAHHDQMVTAFPGALQAVRTLADRGVRLGVVTSKLRAGALRGLQQAGFADLFPVVIGADDVEHPKPHGQPVLAALSALGSRPEQSIMVGDSPHDLAAGRAAGARTAAVAWGPFPRVELEAMSPDRFLEATPEIAQLAAGMG